MMTAALVVAGVLLAYAALAWRLTTGPRCPVCRRRVPEEAWSAHRARCGKPRHQVVPDRFGDR